MRIPYENQTYLPSMDNINLLIPNMNSSDPLLETEKYFNSSRFRCLTQSDSRVLDGVVGARQGMSVTMTVPAATQIA
jgi:hypothetical protein